MNHRFASILNVLELLFSCLSEEMIYFDFFSEMKYFKQTLHKTFTGTVTHVYRKKISYNLLSVNAKETPRSYLSLLNSLHCLEEYSLQ